MECKQIEDIIHSIPTNKTLGIAKMSVRVIKVSLSYFTNSYLYYQSLVFNRCKPWYSLAWGRIYPEVKTGLTQTIPGGVKQFFFFPRFHILLFTIHLLYYYFFKALTRKVLTPFRTRYENSASIHFSNPIPSHLHSVRTRVIWSQIKYEWFIFKSQVMFFKSTFKVRINSSFSQKTSIDKKKMEIQVFVLLIIAQSVENLWSIKIVT